MRSVPEPMSCCLAFKPCAHSTQIFVFILLFCQSFASLSDSINCGHSNIADQHYGVQRSEFSRILHGDKVTPGTWPWVGSLRRMGVHICGASLVHTKWALTAAHCVSKHALWTGRFRFLQVAFGDVRLSGLTAQEQSTRVIRVIVHPLFNRPKARACDIALLELDRHVLLSDEVYPVCMPTYAAVPHSLCVVAGWGRVTEFGATRNDQLRDALVPILPQWKCADKDHYFYLIDHYSMMCAGHEEGGSDSCQGDSGSPLVCMDPLKRRWELHGIVSWGIGCGRSRRPGVYARILPVVGWIRTQLSLDHLPRPAWLTG